MIKFFSVGTIFISLAVFAFFPFIAGAVTVGPVRLEYSVDPGKTINGELFLLNETNEKATFYPSFERFTEDNGQKIFSKENSDLVTWFKIPSAVVLNPGESKQIPVAINVPKNASPGGHFAVMWWGTAPPSEAGKQVSIVTRAGILVYLRVSGNIVESAEISSFRANSRFYTKFPISFSLLFKDTGNVALKPGGEITVSNIFGVVKIVLPVNNDGANVLPQSSKRFVSQWENSEFLIGPYKATINLTYGESKKTISQTYWFFAVSRNFIYILLGLIIVLFFIPKAIKKYNRWIIKKTKGD